MSARTPLPYLRTGLALLVFLACSEGLEPNPIDGLETRLHNRIAVGDMASCAIDSTQTTWCWGDNQLFSGFGLGTPGFFPAKTPLKLSGRNIVSFAHGGSQHRCGLTADGTAVCWGRGGYGQMGRGFMDTTGNTPGEVLGGAKWKSIHTGRLHTCGIDKSGNAWCWGINARGELGNVDAEHGGLNVARIPTPLVVSGGRKWKSLAPGWQHTCGIAEDDKAYCWGSNTYGEMGIGAADTVSHLSPVAIQGSYRFTQLASGWRWTCGITTDQKAVCWGVNTSGQLGDGSTTNRPSPGLVSGNYSFARIAVAFTTSSNNTPIPTGGIQNAYGAVCALQEDGTPLCWGYNGDGQLGDSTTISRTAPTPVAGGIKLTSIAMGTTHTCGMMGNAAWCWGSRESFQLGSDTNAVALFPAKTSPQRVSAPFDRD